MSEIIILPKQGNTVEECLIQRWHKKLHDTVEIDDVLCEVETDKTTMEVTSTAKGTLLHVYYEEGDIAKVLAPIAIVGELKEDISSYIQRASDHIQGASDSMQGASDSIRGASDSIRGASDSMQGTVIAQEVQKHDAENTILPESSKEYDSENAQDKENTTSQNEHENRHFEQLIFSPRARNYLARHGMTQEEFLFLYDFEQYFLNYYHTHNKKLTSARSRIEENILEEFFEKIHPISQIAKEEVLANKKVLNGANTFGAGFKIGSKIGSGPAQKILSTDVANLQTNVEVTRVRKPNNELTTVKGDYTVTELKGVRKIISERMLQSLQQSAQLTLSMSASAVNIQEARKNFKSKGLAISINDMLLYITAKVLAENTWANSHLLQGIKLLEFKDVNIGFAVDTPRGLLVPVIKKMQTLTLSQISEQAKDLIYQCKKGNIALDNLEGSTFTLTNLGSFGIEVFTPILNLPQTGILGIGTIYPGAVYDEEQAIKYIPQIKLSLTFDHRAYDGANGAQFLKNIADAISNFNLEGIYE